jgi:S-adenosylmethionine decarboxylase proenzyme
MIQETKRSVKRIKKNQLNYLGVHLIIEFWNGKVVESEKEIEKILITAAKKSHNTPLDVKIHKFAPRGITGVVLLTESHISIHTWPEFGYAAIDIFSCGKKALPFEGLAYLKKIFQPKQVQVLEIKRGAK